MNPRRSWLRLSLAWSLAGALGGPVVGAESTPAPAAGVFDPSDDAATALKKIRALGFPATTEALVRLQLACRDFCRRFPEGREYFSARRHAVIYWYMWMLPGQNTAALPQIRERLKAAGWDPTDAVIDPKLDAEQRADIAMLLARGRGHQNRDRRKTDDEKSFEALAEMVPQFQGTNEMRDTLIDAAMRLPPERKAIALSALRKHYPADDRAAKALALLEQLGKPIELKFTTLDGRSVDLRDYRGKVVLLEFWSKGCAGCIESIPALKALDARFGPRGFAILGVNMDSKRADAEEIVRKHALPWPQAFDGKGWHAALAEQFLAKSIPRGVLIDPEGRLRDLDCGVRGDEDIRRIERLLPSRPPRAAK